MDEGDVSSEDQEAMRPLLFAIAEIPPQFPEAIRLGLIEGLLDYGRKFVAFVNTAAREDPERFSARSQELTELQARWLAGESFSDRADEDDLRARHALWAARQLPGLARPAANRVMELPADHPLRDVPAVRDALLQQLTDAIRSKFEEGLGFSLDRAQRASFALSAIAGLIKHELVPADRLESLFEAGTNLLETPGVDPTHPFRLDTVPYVRARSEEAAKMGNQAEAERWDAAGRNLLRPVLEAETDPDKQRLLRLLLSGAGGDEVGSTEILQELVASTPAEATGSDLERKRAIVSRLMLARRSFAAEDFSEVVGALAPVLPSFTELYLSAVSDADVAEHGSGFSQACQALALSHAHLEEWDRAVTHIDQCKSLRFRYQSALRAAAGGERVIELEAALYAHDRGIASLPPDLDQNQGRGVQASPQSRLLEAYRQVRTSLDPDDMDSPSIGDIAGLLDEEEAVAVLGLCNGPPGVLLAVIRPGDKHVPTGCEVFSTSTAQQLVKIFVDPTSGWLVPLIAPGIGVEPRPALRQLIEVVDSVIGAPLRRMLDDRSRRLTVIPHGLLHLVPFWALPSLEGLAVVAAPSAAQFVKQRSQRPTISRGSLVVGNPTGDLEFAALEAQRVAARLRTGGFEARLLELEHATERDISEGLIGASVFHFSGHGLSDMFRPLLSGLETRPDTSSLGEEGADPLPALAAAAAWQPMEDNERRADLPDGRCLFEHVYPVTDRIELRLESGDRGTLRGRYVWEDDEEGRYGRCLRLAELLTAGDLLQEKALRDCGFVFLSSCSAGLGGLSPDVDEFAGLPAALQLAGASIVVSPLWPVDEVSAALFADLFYAEMASAAGEVDIPALVGEVRAQMRRMDAEEAADRIEGLAAEAGTLLESTLLSARALKVRDGPEHPFQHAFDWAAFHAVGAPVAVIEERPDASTQRPTEGAAGKSFPGRP